MRVLVKCVRVSREGVRMSGGSVGEWEVCG